MIIGTGIPSNAEVLQIAKQANAQHLRIVTDGKKTMLCRPEHTPAGWYPIGVKTKRAA